MKRQISISVHDYARTKLCDLFNLDVRAEGQAYNIVTTKEENGWKELSFSIAAKVMENNELVDNYRLALMKNEYLVRVQENDKIDWFILSEPNITHRDRSLVVDVTCGHISSLLRTKNLYLELDDTNGIGTCSALANTILQNTGWTLGNCDIFYEADGTTEKVRTLKSANKTGSYQMILNLCNLFNARPIFNGDTKTIDIHVFNPFNNPLDPTMPVIEDAEKVFELNYGKALKGISRKLDTNTLITRLNVEGAYSEDGYIGIESVNDELGFLTDFSYFSTLGIFTSTHQTALTTYLTNAKAAKASIKSTMSTINEKETAINALWGSNYGVYNITGVTNATTISLSEVYSSAEDPVLEADDWIVLMNSNGTHVYSKIASGTIGSLVIQDAVAVAGHTKAVVFYTPAYGLIGGKESALFAVEKLMEQQIERLDAIDTDYTTLFVQATAPASGMVANDIWVDTDYLNLPPPDPNGPRPVFVWRYVDSAWTTPVDGRKASYAESVAKSRVRIDELLVGNSESDGLYDMMIEADGLARQLPALYSTYEGYVDDLEGYESTFTTAMGDMLRDGYWNDSNYVIGQETELLADAEEIMDVMAQPVATYSIEMIDLYEAGESSNVQEAGSLVSGITASFTDDDLIIEVPSNVPGISFPTPIIEADGDLEVTQTGDSMNAIFSLESGYLFVESGSWLADIFTAPSWQDIDIDFCVHIIDDEINISAWGFIERISKCYDKPWETQISISTKKSDITGKSFTDILASVAAIAEEVRGKSDVYDRSKVISSAGELSTTALQGIIDVNKLAMLSTMSNWGTDNNGNLVFQSLDGRAAMMLTGMGFMISNEKDLDGNWIRRTFGTGDGFSADEINTGVLNAGIVQILGTDQFYWNADNIYIYDTSEPLNQIRIGRYDGTNYGIGFTNDGGSTWQTAVGFDGGHLGSVDYDTISGQISDIVEDISEIDGAVSDIEDFTNTAFADGVVTRAEKEALKVLLTQLDTEKSDIDSKYNSIYADTNLSGTPKTSLATAKTDYNNAHSALLSSINTAIADNTITTAERADIAAKLATYKTELGDLSTAFEVAIRSIESAKDTALSGTLTTEINKKNKHFTSTPSGPYAAGDTWTQLATGKTYVCNTGASTGFNAAHWTLQETVMATFSGTYAQMIVLSGMKVGDIWLIKGDTATLNGRTYYAVGTSAGAASWALTSTRKFSGAAVSWDAETGTVDIAAGQKVSISSGGTLELVGNNLVTIGSGGDLNMVGSDITISSGGNMNLETGTNLFVKSGADIEIESGGDINVVSGGKINVASGGDINVSSGGKINIAATDLNIGAQTISAYADDKITLAVSTVKPGSRNYFKGSKYATTQWTQTDLQIFTSEPGFTMKAGHTYCVTMYARKTGVISYRLWGNEWGWSQLLNSGSFVGEELNTTIITPSVDVLNPYVMTADSNGTDYHIYDWAILEETTNPSTDWYPAASDPATGVITSHITIETDSIDIASGGSLNMSAESTVDIQTNDFTIKNAEGQSLVNILDTESGGSLVLGESNVPIEFGGNFVLGIGNGGTGENVQRIHRGTIAPTSGGQDGDLYIFHSGAASGSWSDTTLSPGSAGQTTRFGVTRNWNVAQSTGYYYIGNGVGDSTYDRGTHFQFTAPAATKGLTFVFYTAKKVGGTTLSGGITNYVVALADASFNVIATSSCSATTVPQTPNPQTVTLTAASNLTSGATYYVGIFYTDTTEGNSGVVCSSATYPFTLMGATGGATAEGLYVKSNGAWVKI